MPNSTNLYPTLVVGVPRPPYAEGVCAYESVPIVRVLVIGCTFLLLVVGCAGVRSEAPQEKQRHTEATNNGQGRTAEATPQEQARCEGTRTISSPMADRGHTGIYTTNDLPGCLMGGLLLDTDKTGNLWGGEGDDEIRGLGGKDDIGGGDGNDVIYGGDGDDVELFDGKGADVIYGGGGNDYIESLPDDQSDKLYGGDGNDFIGSFFPNDQPDKLYCGKGKDRYVAEKIDYVDSSCEKTALG